MLEILAEYFCLTTNDVAATQRKRTPTQDDKRTIRRTLALLYEEGFLSRLPYLDLEQDCGGRTYVYGLSKKGCAWVSENLPSVDIHKPFDEHSARTLDHELAISSFHRAIKSFCDQSGLYLYWQQKDLKKTVSPDALFAITDPKQPEGKDTLYYFLEIERAKIGNFKNGEPSILRKLGRYYEYYDTKKCQEEWEYFRQFRVIVVQRNEAKREFLLERLKQNYKHRMFWLTTELAYQCDIGAPIFLAPTDPEVPYSF